MSRRKLNVVQSSRIAHLANLVDDNLVIDVTIRKGKENIKFRQIELEWRNNLRDNFGLYIAETQNLERYVI